MSWSDYNSAKPSPWTPELEVRLTALWSDGVSASECAIALGHNLTKNAVIGKVHRLKLAARRPHKVKASSTWSAERVERARRRREAQAAMKKAREKRVKKLVAASTPPAEVVAPQPKVSKQTAWDPLPGSTPIGIMDLTDATCRWPVGDLMARTTSYCGCQTVEGKHYCEHHYELSLGEGTPSERSAIKAAKQMANLERFIPDREAA